MERIELATDDGLETSRFFIAPLDEFRGRQVIGVERNWSDGTVVLEVI